MIEAMSKTSADAIASEKIDDAEITNEAARDLAAAALAPIAELPPGERLRHTVVKPSLYHRI